MQLTKTPPGLAEFYLPARPRHRIGGSQMLLVVKLVTIFMLAAVMQVSASGTAQTVTYSGTNVPLTKVLSVIEKQTGYAVFYRKQDIKDAAPVNISLNKADLKTALNELLKDSELEFQIEENTVFIRPKPAEQLNTQLLFSPPPEFIRGIVRDSTGMPLSGATVMNKRTKKSVITDANGEFKIEAELDDVLTMSYVGFESQSVKVKGSSVFAILGVSRSPLDEIQIIAYGTTTRRLNTGSVFTVKSDDLAKQPVGNPLLALLGRVPNLNITQTSGMPGAPIKIQLRGQNSIGRTVSGPNVASEPLIIVDGIPYPNNMPGAGYGFPGLDPANLNLNALSFINISDIESITVLADSDASSIYGSRGGNGVIIITTKRGRTGGSRVDINVSMGTSNVPKKLKLLNTQEYLQMRREAYVNDGLEVPDHQMNSAEKNVSNYDLSLWDSDRYTDWQEKLRGGTAKRISSRASVSGGNSNVNYLISGNYDKQGYVFPGDSKWESYNGHFSLQGSGFDHKLKTSISGTYAVQRSKAVSDLSFLAVTMAPNAPAIYNSDGLLNWEPDPRTGKASWRNPYAQLSLATTQRTTNVTATADISYQISKTLSVKTAVGFTDLKLNSFGINSLIGSSDPATRATATGTSRRSNNSVKSMTVDPQVIYSDNIAKGRLEAIAGWTYQSNNTSVEFLEARGYRSDQVIDNLAFASGFTARNPTSQYKYTGAFARFNYNWEEKYIFNTSGRRDGSSRFGPLHQFGNFWALGGAWIFSNEKFIKNNLSFLSFGKLRGSYGTSGNDGIGDYSYIELYRVSLQEYTYQNIGALASNGVVNPDYKWENVKKFEVALETGLLNDRLLMSGAYWSTRSSDQLGLISIPFTTGANTIITNLPAKIENSGFDITFTTRNIISKNFSWNTSGNIGWKKNKLLSLPESYGFAPDPYINLPVNGQLPNDQEAAKNAIGKPFSGIVGLYDFHEVDPQLGTYVFAAYDGSTAYANVNTPYQPMKIISTLPKYMGGISNTFSYKGISLDIFVQFAKQIGRNYVYQAEFGQPGQFLSTSNIGNQPAAVLDRFQKTGDKKNIQKFSTGYGDTYLAWNQATQSDLAWVDASFIRLKNVAFSYSLPKKWKNTMKVKDMRITVNAQNLATLTNYEGTDPESQSVTSLPPLRTIVVGLSLSF